jgi:hypothetical protein
MAPEGVHRVRRFPNARRERASSRTVNFTIKRKRHAHQESGDKQNGHGCGEIGQTERRPVTGPHGPPFTQTPPVHQVEQGKRQRTPRANPPLENSQIKRQLAFPPHVARPNKSAHPQPRQERSQHGRIGIHRIVHEKGQPFCPQYLKGQGGKSREEKDDHPNRSRRFTLGQNRRGSRLRSERFRKPVHTQRQEARQNVKAPRHINGSIQTELANQIKPGKAGPHHSS